MSKARQTALEFFQSPTKNLWYWNDSGREIVWHDGATIAFREEIDAVVLALASRALPPFTAIVLLLAAGRGKIPPAVREGENVGVDRGGILEALKARANSRVIAEFKKVHSLPDSIVRTLEGKVFLAQTVFEAFRELSPLDAREVAAGVHEIWTDAELNSGSASAARDSTIRLAHLTAERLSSFDAETLLRRKKLGIDGIPGAADEIELPVQERACRFLSELSGDPQFAGYAALTKELMAAIRLPKRVTDSDDHAVTGNAGLGNRGTLDRLLLSELAHDDDTLASRIAMNEALYTLREPPASKPDRALSILIDAGIRMWGIPRILATSAALGLLAGHKGKGSVRVSRSESGSLVRAELLTREGLESHLAVLDFELDPRRVLSAVEKELQDSGEADFVLITNRSSFQSEAFTASLGTMNLSSGFILTVESSGAVQLHRFPWGNPRALAETQVDIDRLMNLPNGAEDKRKSAQTLQRDDLPAILSELRLPLLMPVCSELSMAAHTKDGGVCVVAGRRLLRWVGRNRGAVELHADLPQGKTVWIGADPNGNTVVVKGRSGNGKMSVIVAREAEAETFLTQFTGPKAPQYSFIDKNVLIVILHSRIVVCSLENGELLCETAFPDGTQWISERYFYAKNGVKFVYWNGASIEWDEAISGRSIVRDDIAFVFGRKGVGAWLLLRDGRVLSPTGGEYMSVGFRVSHADAKAEGEILVVLEHGSMKYHRVDLEKKDAAALRSEIHRAVIDRVVPPTRAIQTKFSAIAWGPGQPIRLKKPKGKWLEIHLAKQSLRLAESGAAKGTLEASMQSFRPQNLTQSAGFSLQAAEWPNGSEAWLDSRGLLHLKSRDSNLPELTLTLNQGDIAAWTSEGKYFGPQFFIGDHPDAGIAYIASILSEISSRL